MPIIPTSEQQITLDFSEHLPEPTKFCRTCQQYKPLDEFSRCTHLKSGRISNCRACFRKWQKECYRRTKGRGARNCHLRDTYGITLEQYAEMLDAQGRMCAICGKKAPVMDAPRRQKHSYAVDHDHKTGKVRSILCPSCNTGLGLFKDNPDLLVSAARYLKRHAKQVLSVDVSLFAGMDGQTV